MFDQLLDFKKRYKHVYVPRTYGRLGRWVDDQRVHYRLFKAGNVSLLDAIKIEMLEKEGFCWKHDSKRSKKWQDMYQVLIQFRKENGHCNVPKKFPPNQKLGSWVDYQRTLHRCKRNGSTGNSMTQARVDLMNQIGFRWLPTLGNDEEVPNFDKPRVVVVKNKEEKKYGSDSVLNGLSVAAFKTNSSPKPYKTTSNSFSPTLKVNTADVLKDLKRNADIRLLNSGAVVRPTVTEAAMVRQKAHYTPTVSHKTIGTTMTNGRNVIRIVKPAVQVNNNSRPVRTVVVPAPTPNMQMLQQPHRQVETIVIRSLPNHQNFQVQNNQEPMYIVQNGIQQQQQILTGGRPGVVTYVSLNGCARIGAPMALVGAPNQVPGRFVQSPSNIQQRVFYQ